MKWFPTTWTLENYQMAIQNYPLWTWTKNSAIVTLAVLLLSSVFCIMPAYGLAVTDFRGKTALVFIMMASIMIPKELSAIYSWPARYVCRYDLAPVGRSDRRVPAL